MRSWSHPGGDSSAEIMRPGRPGPERCLENMLGRQVFPVWFLAAGRDWSHAGAKTPPEGKSWISEDRRWATSGILTECWDPKWKFRGTVGLEELVVAGLDGEALGGGALDAGMREALGLDVLAEEKRDGENECQVHEVAAGVSMVVGQNQVGQPGQRRPDTRGRRAGQSVTERRVADRED